MKSTKILSMILAVCMLLSVCVLSAAAAEEAVDNAPDASEPEQAEDLADTGAVSGAWTFSNFAADNCTADEKAILTKALEGFGGISLDPRDVIATQVVAGTNYAFLCMATPIVPDAVSHWAVVTVFAATDGSVQLVGTVDIDPADVKVKNDSADAETGAWSSAAKQTGAPLPTAVFDALNSGDGMDFVSIAVLGTQPVSGTNYRILCYGTTVTAQPKTDLYVVDVYENIQGTAEVTSVAKFDLEAYIAAPKPVEEETEASTEAATEAGEKSPKTGGSSASALAILLEILAAAGACVSVYTITKKRG